MSMHSAKRRNPNVALSPIVYELAKRVAIKIGVPITELVSTQLEMQLRALELAESLKPFLTLDSMGENSLYIKDLRKGKEMGSAEVRVRYTHDKEDYVQLECIKDKSMECIHVAFASGLPQLGKLNITKKKLVEMILA
jgi:hypothetical protein